jgi:transcriptional regulator with XRE-family HTH domain
MAVEAGAAIRERRLQRRMSLRTLSALTGLTATTLQRMEAGHPASLEGYARVAIALGLRPDLDLTDPRRPAEKRQADAVHSWMGDVEAGWLLAVGRPSSIDEPYQHFQFAGRADVLSVWPEECALLHIENRTRFPDLQEAAGSYNTKRSYLARVIADRLGLRGGFRAVTHVMACLWSAEVLHILRMRTATMRSICPDGPGALEAWLRGQPPPSGTSSSLIVMDPLDRPRSRRWIDLDTALRVEPRYRGYADAVAAMPSAHGTDGRLRSQTIT